MAKIGSRDCNLIVNRLQSRGMKREIGALAATALLLHWSATREVLSREQSRRPGRDAPRTGMMVCDRMYARKTANENRSSTPISLKMSLVHRAHGSGSTCDQLVLSRNAISKLARRRGHFLCELFHDQDELHRDRQPEVRSASCIYRPASCAAKPGCTVRQVPLRSQDAPFSQVSVRIGPGAQYVR